MSGDKKTIFLPILIIMLSIIVAYSNSMNCGWQLDDEPNITMNKVLQIKDLSSSSLKQSLYAAPNGRMEKLYRPVACFTLALNWYFGRDDVFGYHLVNLSAHVITALLLYFTLLQLTHCPQVRKRYQEHSYFIALFGSLFWALNPIQTQAVTYIVQRMAALAALFYLLAILLYLKGRVAAQLQKRLLFYTGCLMSFLLAIFSKENAITLPLALLLVEMVFFQDMGDHKVRRKLIYGMMAVAVCALLASSFLFLNKDIFSFLYSYKTRYFSLSERVLTEPRIIVMYLSQLFYPIPAKLSISHDIELSKSLFVPWATMPAIIFLLSMVILAFLKIQKYPLLAFGILFYFLNHAIESSIIALELVFEHRNYLPSLFLFAPIASLMKNCELYFGQRPIKKIITAFPVILVLMMIAGTFLRNMDWKNTESLWSDALKKAPHTFRPHYYLAGLYQKRGQLDLALEHFTKSEKYFGQAADPLYAWSSLFNGTATVYLQKGEFEKGLALIEQVLERNPEFEASMHNRVVAFLKLGRVDDALVEAKRLVRNFPDVPEYFFLKGVALLRLNDFYAAADSFLASVRVGPENVYMNLGLAVAAKLRGDYSQAIHYFKRAEMFSIRGAYGRLALLEMAVTRKDQEAVEESLQILEKKYTREQIDITLAENAKIKILFSVFSNDVVQPLISEKFGLSKHN